MEKDREDLVYLAMLCEQAEKYHDMAETMTQIAQLHPTLTELERNLFIVSFKNIVVPIRSAIGIITSLEDKEMAQNNFLNMVRIQKYRAKLEDELRQQCNILNDILEKNLIPNAQDPVDKVAYYKMQGDYWRYLAEIEKAEAKISATERAQSAYDTAFIFAEHLRPVHSIRIGLSLNYSVFCHEILKHAEQAQEVVRKVYDDIMEALHTISDEEMTDLEPLLRLIQNLPPFQFNDVDEEEENEYNDPESGVLT
jgi:14-3-3 protein epsilon